MSEFFFKNGKFFPSNKLIVGCDISKKDFWFCAVTGGCEYISKKFKCRINRKGLDVFLVRLGKLLEKSGCCDLVVGMEPSGPYWFTLAQYLTDNGIEVVLVNPYHLSRTKEVYDNSPRKNDRKDAFLVARMVEEGKFLRNAVLDDVLKALRHLLNDYRASVQELTAVKNRLQSLLAEYFPEYMECFSEVALVSSLKILTTYPLPCDIIKAGEEKLTKLLLEASRGKKGASDARLLVEKARETIGVRVGLDQVSKSVRRKVDRIKFLKEELAELKKEMENLVANAPGFEYLSSIPGINTVTICGVLCGAGDLKNYRTSEELLKMLGLNVCEFSSGKWQGDRRISKRGNSTARWILYLAAVRSVRKDGIFYDKFCKMVSRGKNKKKALIAIACDLVRIMHALVRDQRTFEADYKPVCMRKKSDNPKVELEAACENMNDSCKESVINESTAAVKVPEEVGIMRFKRNSGSHKSVKNSKTSKAERDDESLKCGKVA